MSEDKTNLEDEYKRSIRLVEEAIKRKVKEINEEELDHRDWINALVAFFESQGYKLIIEGGIPNSLLWGRPDIFVLKSLFLEKIVEVSISDPYEGNVPNSVFNKCKKIKEYYNPPEIIVFEPTEYTDKRYPDTLNGFKSYVDYHQYLREKWKKEGLNVTFWNESIFKREKEGVES